MNQWFGPSQLPSLQQAAAAWSHIMSLKDPLTGVPIVKRLRTNEFYKGIFAVLCFFWKAYLSIKQPLTAHGPIHPRVSSRHRSFVHR